MNLDVVLMCARMAAAKQLSGLGYVDPEIQAIIDELTPAPVVEAVVEETPVVEETSVEEPAPKSKKSKAAE